MTFLEVYVIVQTLGGGEASPRVPLVSGRLEGSLQSDCGMCGGQWEGAHQGPAPSRRFHRSACKIYNVHNVHYRYSLGVCQVVVDFALELDIYWF